MARPAPWRWGVESRAGAGAAFEPPSWPCELLPDNVQSNTCGLTVSERISGRNACTTG